MVGATPAGVPYIRGLTVLGKVPVNIQFNNVARWMIDMVSQRCKITLWPSAKENLSMRHVLQFEAVPWHIEYMQYM